LVALVASFGPLCCQRNLQDRPSVAAFADVPLKPAVVAFAPAFAAVAVAPPVGASVISAPVSCHQALVLVAAVATTETALAVGTVVAPSVAVGTVAAVAVAVAVGSVGSVVGAPKVEAEGPRSQVVAVASVAQTYSISNGFSQYKLIANENIVDIILGANLFSAHKRNGIRAE